MAGKGRPNQKGKGVTKNKNSGKVCVNLELIRAFSYSKIENVFAIMNFDMDFEFWSANFSDP